MRIIVPGHDRASTRSKLGVFYVIAGLACLAVAVNPASAQERMPQRGGMGGMQEHGGMRGNGVGAGISIGIDILSTLPQQQQQNTPAKAGGTTSKTTKTKKRAKKGDDTPPQKAQRDNPPQKGPPDNPPQKGPPDNPQQTPPPTPPTTAGGPPTTGGGPPPTPPGPPSTTDTPPTTGSQPPTGNTPGGGNTVTLVTTARTHRKLSGNDCPQRGKGCAVLILDYSKAATTEFDLENVAKSFGDVCGSDNVQYVAPKFAETVEQEKGESDADFAARARKARDDYKTEQTKVTDAIAKHRKLVAQGVELAVELLNGHGDTIGTCGIVGPDVAPTAGEGRAGFHLGNYNAAYDNVCQWFVADFTCYSGKTPFAVDELNNTGAVACKGPVGAESCPMHAAYDSDVAFGNADATHECSNMSVQRTRTNIADALKAEVARRAGATTSGDLRPLVADLQKVTAYFGGWNSQYIDNGYKACGRQPPKGYP